MKLKSLLILTFLVVFVITEFGGSLVSANWTPIYTNIEISPQSVGATSPTITFLSPENDKTYGRNLTLHCNISLGAVSHENMSCSIENLYYQADWESQPTKVIRLQLNKDGNNWDTIITGSVNSDFTEYSNNLTAPTEGKHSITVWATEKGNCQVDMGQQFPSERINVYTFHINSSKTVTFRVDNSQPEASPLTPATVSTSEFPSPTPNQELAFDFSQNQTTLILVTTVITIVAVASVSFVFFKRKSGKR
jgi:hypothetical protein